MLRMTTLLRLSFLMVMLNTPVHAGIKTVCMNRSSFDTLPQTWLSFEQHEQESGSSVPVTRFPPDGARVLVFCRGLAREPAFAIVGVSCKVKGAKRLIFSVYEPLHIGCSSDTDWTQWLPLTEPPAKTFKLNP